MNIQISAYVGSTVELFIYGQSGAYSYGKPYGNFLVLIFYEFINISLIL